MLQQLTITTTDKITLKPLVESAIENEKRMLALGIERTRKRLAEFKQKFGMSSAEFERRLNALELIETVEFTDSVDGKLLAEAAPTPPIRGHGSPMALTLSGCTGMTDSENPFG
ncbi:MAG: hypothetical protein WBW48_13720, partial [Anaerolineae bacterium]